MRKDTKQDKVGLGLLLVLCAFLGLGYGMGSPAVAPMLPAKLERPFSNMHKDLNEAGLKAIRSVAWIFPG
jgi:hypothetical protein